MPETAEIKIERLIKKLTLEDDKKFVIAIEGYSGSGKTTLLKKLVRRNKAILPVFLDDFIRTGKSRRASLKKAKDKPKVVELKWNNIQKVRRLMKVFRVTTGPYSTSIYDPETDRYDKTKTFDMSKKVLILEGIFLFHPKLFQRDFDARVYLDADVKKADMRRRKREQKRWGKEYFSEHRPDSFVRLFKIAYSRYVKQYQPKKEADLVIKT